MTPACCCAAEEHGLDLSGVVIGDTGATDMLAAQWERQVLVKTGWGESSSAYRHTWARTGLHRR